jgi:chromosome segregation ATPase
MEHDDKKEILEAIGSLIAEQTRELKEDVHGVKVDVQELKGDVHVLKVDVQELKRDTHVLKGDVQELKRDTHVLKGDVQELKEGRNEILEAIQAFAEQNDCRLNTIESEMVSMKSQMVTKDYLDNKLTDLRSDLIVLTRKENTKLSVLVEELVVSKSLSRKSADRILLMEPFSRERTG